MRLFLTIVLLIFSVGCGFSGFGINNPSAPSPENSPTDTPSNPSPKAITSIIIRDDRFVQGIIGRDLNNGPIQLIIHLEQPDPDNPGQTNEQDIVDTTEGGNISVDNLNPGPVSIYIQIPEWGTEYGGSDYLEPGDNTSVVAPSGSPEDFQYQSMIMMFSNGYSTIFHDITWSQFLVICQENFANGNSPDDVYMALIGMGSSSQDIFWTDYSTGEAIGNLDGFILHYYSSDMYIGSSGNDYHMVFDKYGRDDCGLELNFEVYNQPKEVCITMFHLTERNSEGKKGHPITINLNGIVVDNFYQTSSDWYTQDDWYTTKDGEAISSYISPGTNQIFISNEGSGIAHSDYWLKWVRIRCIY